MTQAPVVNHIHRAVVVGVDESAPSWAAIRAAAWEADQRGQDLVLAHGYYPRMPYGGYDWPPFVPDVEDGLEAPRAWLAGMAAKVRERHPGLAVHTELLAGGGSGALVQLSQLASLVVVGSRGHGGFAGLSLGSVAAQTAAYAASPVLVIRTPGQTEEEAGVPEPDGAAEQSPAAAPNRGPVLVAVNGSAHDEATLRFAYEEASLRRARLVGVHVWSSTPAINLPAERIDADNLALRAEAERVIAEAMAGWSSKYPDVAVEHRAIEAGNTSAALIEASVGAGLVVMGCRGRGGFAGLLLGSVSRDLVGHAQSPVAVVHEHA